MKIMVYFCSGAPENKRWLALVVLPNGDFWGINCFGPTEAVAAKIARDLYDAEIAKKRREVGRTE